MVQSVESTKNTSWNLKQSKYILLIHISGLQKDITPVTYQKVFARVSPVSCLCFFCTNIQRMCWSFYFYFKNRNWKNLLKILDTTN